MSLNSGPTANYSFDFSTFDEAGFTETILGNVKKANFTNPTPIQRFAIPIIMDGHDLMACAQTGSGKTVFIYFSFRLHRIVYSLFFKAAYLLPVLACMLKRGELSTQASEIQEPSAIVVVPTRELVSQIVVVVCFFVFGFLFF